MKTSHDPRHKTRQGLVKLLFTHTFHNTQRKNKRLQEITSKMTDIDKTIGKIAPEYPIEKINRIDLAILRLAVYELTEEKKEPPKVIIDEAIELAKEFGGESSPAFINGALGKLLKKTNS